MSVNETAKRLKLALGQSRHSLHNTGDPDGFYAARIFRITRLLPRVIKHARFVAKRRKRLEARLRQLSEIRDAKRRFEAGAPFICFDLEWHPETMETQEVGYTLFSRFGYETHNFQVAGVKGIELPNFSYGKTKVASMQAIHLQLRMAARGVENYVGHSLKSDISQLRRHDIRLDVRRIYDTSYWSTIHTKNMRHMALANLGELYGLSSDVLHCAGNDSRYNAELFVKMLHKHS